MGGFVFVGDVHLTSKSFPRVDDTVVATFRKLRFVLDYARDNFCSVIFTGDFLHNNNVSTSVLLDAVALFKSYPDVACHTIGGNHECRGTDFGSYSASQIQLLFHAGALRYLPDGALPMGDGTYMAGYSAYDSPPAASDAVSVLVCHHSVARIHDDPLYVDVVCLKAMYPNLRLLVAGHDHSFYPVTVVDGVRVVRPGSLVRMTRARSNDRKPCFAHLDADGSVRYKVIPSPPFKDLFVVETKDSSKPSSAVVDEFLATVSSRRSLSLTDTVVSLLDGIPESSRPIVVEDLRSHSFL